jgi:hypothetical protein
MQLKNKVCEINEALQNKMLSFVMQENVIKVIL